VPAQEAINELKKRFKPEANTESGSMINWLPINDTIFVGQIPNRSGMEKYKAVLFNGDGKSYLSFKNTLVLKKYGRATTDLESIASIYQHNGKVYFKELLNDTIFALNDDYLMRPVYSIILGNYRQPNSERELPLMEMLKHINKYIFINSIYEISQYLFLECNFGDLTPARRPKPIILKEYGVLSAHYLVGMLGIFNKLSGELVFAQPASSDDRLTNSGLYNDFDGGPNFFPKKMVNDSTLSMWVDAYQLKAHVASETFKNATPKYPEKKKELEKLANSLSDNDNPVLILCTFKK